MPKVGKAEQPKYNDGEHDGYAVNQHFPYTAAGNAAYAKYREDEARKIAKYREDEARKIAKYRAKRDEGIAKYREDEARKLAKYREDQPGQKERAKRAAQSKKERASRATKKMRDGVRAPSVNEAIEKKYKHGGLVRSNPSTVNR